MKLSKNKLISLLRFVIPVMMLFIMNNTFGQDIIVTGRVTDSNDGLSLPGVNVVIQGTTSGVITGLNGEYSIKVPDEESILMFSFIGYQNAEFTVGELRVINVPMKIETTALDEIVVIGYGKVKKSDLTGAVGSIKSDELTKISSVSPEQALQGKISGVRVTSSSGAPGASPTVRIRGVGTFGNPDPIFVVDGVILNDISFLNPSDISSVEVLKDASSTAMYGSRGANGVIIVTTKSGQPNTKPSISFSANYELQTIQKYIDMLDSREFANVMNTIQPGTFNNLNALPNTDWQRLVYRDYAPTQSYQLSLSGGNENVNYYAGVGYLDQEGIIPKSGYEKLSIKLNSQYSISKNVRVGHNFTVTPFKQKNAANIVASTLRAWPTDSAYDYQGNLYGNRGNGNPLASLKYNNSTREGMRSVGNFYGEVDFLEHFTFRSSFGVDIENSDSKSFTPVFYVTPQQNNDETALSKTKYSKNNWLWENTINFNIEKGIHRIDAVMGYTAQEDNWESLTGSGKNLLRDDVQYLGMNLTDITLGNFAEKTSIASYLFRANYVLKGRYLLTATFRRDGSSIFEESNRWGNFPSFAAGWNISEESFFNSEQVSNLKLRFSYGVVGNDKVPWSQRFTLINNNAGAVFGTSELLVPGSTYGNSGNPNLRWEEAYQTDIGIELGMWNNSLTAELDLYNKKTKDILMLVPLAGHMGNGSFASTYYNVADVLNQGIELSLSYKNNYGDFFYEINAVGSVIKNEVTKLGDDVELDNFIPLGSLGNGQNVKRIAVGQSIGYFFGYQVEGIFQNEQELALYPHLPSQEVGDFRYKDVTGEGILNKNDMTKIGSSIPDLMFGLNFSLEYKGFFTDLDFQAEIGREIYDGKDAVRAGQYNYQGRIADAWNGEGSSNTEPRVTSAGINYSQSDWFIFDGSFFRLRNLTIGYSLPQSLLGNLNIEKVNIFLRGTNIFTLTKYPGYSPEIGGSISSNGIDTGIYPVTSVYGLGINLTF